MQSALSLPEISLVRSNFQMRKLFRLFDKNQSGAVDFTEFLNFLLPTDTTRSGLEASSAASSDGMHAEGTTAEGATAEGATADAEQMDRTNDVGSWTEVPLGVQWEAVQDEQGRRRIVAKKHHHNNNNMHNQKADSSRVAVATRRSTGRSRAMPKKEEEQAALALETFTV